MPKFTIWRPTEMFPFPARINYCKSTSMPLTTTEPKCKPMWTSNPGKTFHKCYGRQFESRNISNRLYIQWILLSFYYYPQNCLKPSITQKNISRNLCITPQQLPVMYQQPTSKNAWKTRIKMLIQHQIPLWRHRECQFHLQMLKYLHFHSTSRPPDFIKPIKQAHILSKFNKNIWNCKLSTIYFSRHPFGSTPPIIRWGDRGWIKWLL